MVPFFTQSNSVRAALEIFSSVFSFCKMNGYYWWKYNFYRLICRHDFIAKFFWRCFVSLVKFSYRSKFYVNTIAGSGVMTTFFYKVLTINPEIGNTLVWVLHNTWGLGWVRDTKFGSNVSNKMLLNAAKYEGYSFYHFWVIKEKLTGGGRGFKITSPPPTPKSGLKDKLSKE